MSLVSVEVPRSPPTALPPVVAGILLVLAGAGRAPATGVGASQAPGDGQRQGPEAAVAGRAEVPEGLHELVLWEDLQAMRTFVERVEPLELSGGREILSAPAVAEAARRLDGWEEAFRYVRDRVRHVPYAGSVRGAAGTLRSGGGNSLDQALLLSQLVEALGGRSRLMRGRLSWQQAARLLGGYGRGAEDADDDAARLLGLETAADHWWVEVDLDGTWTALDPSFPDSSPGAVYARAPETATEIPASLRAMLSVELRAGEHALARLQAAAADVAGETVRAWGTPHREGADETAAEPETAATPDGAGRATGPRSIRAPRPRWEAAWPGPWELHLSMAGQEVEIGPLETVELPALTFHVELRAPLAPVRTVEIPWGDLGEARIAVVSGVGTMVEAAPWVRAAAARLAEAEAVAYQAMRPPKDYAGAVRGIRAAAIEAWEAFDSRGPEAVGSALLQALQRTITTAADVDVVVAGLPLAVVRFDPPHENRSARLVVGLDAPVVVAASGSLDIHELQLGHGVLQAAVLSQVLHQLSGRPAATAFDATLRAAGGGHGLEWWPDEGAIPQPWTLEGRAAVAADLRSGYGVAAPRTPSNVSGDELIGWWRVAPASGETSGWVLLGGGKVQGGVELGPPWGSEDLDALLGALRTLHRCLPLLAGYPVEGQADLETVPQAACAAADLAAEVLVQVVPTVDRPAIVRALCSGGRATTAP